MGPRTERAVYALGIVSLGLFLALFFTSSWVELRRLGTLRVQAETLGQRLLAEHGVRLEGLEVLAKIENNLQTFDFLAGALHPREALTAFSKHVTPYRLSLGWGVPRAGGKENAIEDRPHSIQVDGSGRLLAFRVSRAEAAASARLEGTAAVEAATQWLQSLPGLDAQRLDPQPEVIRDERDGIRFDAVRWEGQEPELPEVKLSVNVELNGTAPVAFERTLILPPGAEASLRTRARLANFLPMAGMFLVFGIAFLVFIQRIRREQIDFRLGGAAGATLFIGFAFGQGSIFAAQPQLEGLIWLIITAINSFVFGLIGVTLFSAGESVAREHWPEKLATLDGLLAGHWRSTRTGRSILLGGSVAAINLAAEQIVKRWVVPAAHGVAIESDSILVPLNTWSPGVCLLGLALLGTALSEGALRLFLLSWLRPWMRSLRWLGVLGALVSAGVFYQDYASLRPVAAGLVLAAASSALLVWAFLAGELAIGVFAVLMQSLVPPGFKLLALGGPFTLSGLGLLGTGGAIVGLGVLSLVRPRAPRQRAYVPPYVSRLQERARQQHELDLARRAQLSILPRSVPVIQGFDIATVCVPAMEVGGDYFDFFPLGERRLGVVVGDVSGKGIRAAFYMTLAKGILLSLATSGRFSPREVLLRLNELFYGQVERGVFLSVVLGEFDLDRGTLTLARAGHNPLIAVRAGGGRHTEIAPQGIAIGLDPGRLFESTLEEKTVALARGDVFLFYTDGFTEAMNAKREEFGEERMCSLLLSSTREDATALLGEINAELQAFVADTPQHDDMTMVLIRITDAG